ncbi:MAG: hypothetical protein F7B95_00570 [Desulfurococcales archaeon]|nr:hypothetical protein [Desulfurococcales archaeon]
MPRDPGKIKVRLLGNLALIETETGGMAVVPLHSVCSLIRRLNLEVIEGDIKCPEVLEVKEVAENVDIRGAGVDEEPEGEPEEEEL